MPHFERTKRSLNPKAEPETAAQSRRKQDCPRGLRLRGLSSGRGLGSLQPWLSLVQREIHTFSELQFYEGFFFFFTENIFT